VGGGSENSSVGECATVPGGWQYRAVVFRFAAGRRAKADHVGAATPSTALQLAAKLEELIAKLGQTRN
jgi:hypothetical protein